jgi:hypothetical protein
MVLGVQSRKSVGNTTRRMERGGVGGGCGVARTDKKCGSLCSGFPSFVPLPADQRNQPSHSNREREGVSARPRCLCKWCRRREKSVGEKIQGRVHKSVGTSHNSPSQQQPCQQQASCQMHRQWLVRPNKKPSLRGHGPAGSALASWGHGKRSWRIGF